MKKAPSPLARTRRKRIVRMYGGFTLVEVLVSMTVLVVIIALLAQAVGNATSSIQHSTKGMDSNQLATVALDRVGDSIAGMVTSGEGTLVAIKNPTGSDGLVMITNGRVRSRSTGTNVNVNSFTDVRLGVRGFCVMNAPDPDLIATGTGGTYPTVPMLHWGDGTVSFSSQNVTDVQGSPAQALSLAVTDVQNQITSPGTATKMLQLTPLSRGVFRVEIAFLLSDGTTVSGKGPALPLITAYSNNGVAPAPLPRNRYFVTNEALAKPPAQFDTPAQPGAPAYPLAFSALDSDVAPNVNSGGQNVYVRAVIVGIATLDPNTQRILSNTQLAQLAGVQTLQKADEGATPAQTWDISGPSKTTYAHLQSPAFPPPVLQNIRFTQRSYYVR